MMACNCGGRRMTTSGKPANTPQQYEVTLPNGETKLFLSGVEAKVAIRKAGGGTIKRTPRE